MIRSQRGSGFKFEPVSKGRLSLEIRMLWMGAVRLAALCGTFGEEGAEDDGEGGALMELMELIESSSRGPTLVPTRSESW